MPRRLATVVLQLEIPYESAPDSSLARGVRELVAAVFSLDGYSYWSQMHARMTQPIRLNLIGTSVHSRIKRVIVSPAISSTVP